jgi:hypothetical protein
VLAQDSCALIYPGAPTKGVSPILNVCEPGHLGPPLGLSLATVSTSAQHAWTSSCGRLQAQSVLFNPWINLGTASPWTRLALCLLC